ncbi:MAG: thiamine phosphate synthase [Myxococcota bacterium]
MRENDLSVYLVTDNKLTLSRTVEEIVERACSAGVRAVQYRDKESDDKEFVRRALKIREITRRYNAALILNDRVHLVAEVQADGAHIGQKDISLEEAKRALGDDKILGVSFQRVEEAAEAERLGVSYVALSPVFSTATKADIDPPLGIEGVRKTAKIIKRTPIIAIGGINKDNAAEVVAAGATGVAVVTAITLAEDIEKAVKELRVAVTKGREVSEQ